MIANNCFDFGKSQNLEEKQENNFNIGNIAENQ